MNIKYKTFSKQWDLVGLVASLYMPVKSTNTSTHACACALQMCAMPRHRLIMMANRSARFPDGMGTKRDGCTS